MTDPKPTILYADDDLDDVAFVKDCFKRYHEDIDLVLAQDGYEALNVLEHWNESGMTPCLIILDINMPLIDGRQVLVKLKKHEAFKNVPVVMFTTSTSQLDKDFAARWGADFISKPLRFSEVENLAEVFVKRCTGEV